MAAQTQSSLMQWMTISSNWGRRIRRCACPPEKSLRTSLIPAREQIGYHFLPSRITAYVSEKSFIFLAAVRRDSVISREDAQSISKMIKNEDQFDLMFMEGLRESEANLHDKMLSSDKKQDYYNTKQQITVGNRTFEFTQHDSIFKIY
jgi:hypothetical protein